MSQELLPRPRHYLQNEIGSKLYEKANDLLKDFFVVKTLEDRKAIQKAVGEWLMSKSEVVVYFESHTKKSMRGLSVIYHPVNMARCSGKVFVMQSPFQIFPLIAKVL